MSRRMLWLAFMLVVAVVAVMLEAPPAAAAVSCNGQTTTIYYITYFSNSNYNQNVGICRESCTGVTCTGQITPYYTLFPVGCCPD
jgi:hypothetical protein